MLVGVVVVADGDGGGVSRPGDGVPGKQVCASSSQLRRTVADKLPPLLSPC